MGFDYPGAPLLGLALITLVGVIFGTLLGWTRLATGSVWPAVLGHAAMDANQIAGGVLALTAANAALDTTQATLLGWTGWLVPLAVIALLVALRRLPVRNPPDLAAPTEASAAMRAPAAPAETISPVAS